MDIILKLYKLEFEIWHLFTHTVIYVVNWLSYIDSKVVTVNSALVTGNDQVCIVGSF